MPQKWQNRTSWYVWWIRYIITGGTNISNIIFKIGNFNVKTSKFDWMPNNIRTEKIISNPIWVKKMFFELSAMLDVTHCPKLQSYAISRKTYDANYPPPPIPLKIKIFWPPPDFNNSSDLWFLLIYMSLGRFLQILQKKLLYMAAKFNTLNNHKLRGDWKVKAKRPYSIKPNWIILKF